MAYDQRGIGLVHWKRATDNDFAGQITRLLQYIFHARPMNGQEQRVGTLGGLARRTSPRVLPGIVREFGELRLVVRVAEDDIMPGTREQRAELAPHEARAEYADAHVISDR
jgi:hypothetical protein